MIIFNAKNNSCRRSVILFSYLKSKTISKWRVTNKWKLKTNPSSSWKFKINHSFGWRIIPVKNITTGIVSMSHNLRITLVFALLMWFLQRGDLVRWTVISKSLISIKRWNSESNIIIKHLTSWRNLKKDHLQDHSMTILNNVWSNHVIATDS